MTDAVARRFQAVANPHDDSDWTEVCRRAGRRQAPRAALLVAAALAIVAVAAPASGLHEPIVDFVAGERAPEQVVADYDSLNKRTAAIPGHDFQVIAEETREVTTAHLSDGTHTLFVAPTQKGGFCFLWTEMHGSCDRFGSMPLGMIWGGGPPVVSGHVDAEWVHTVEVRFVDGRMEEPKITWVSDPIGAGFFVHEVVNIDDVVSVSALDESGHVLTEQRFKHRVTPAVPQREAIVDRKHRVFAVMNVDGDALTVWSAPSNTEGRCAWFEFRGRTGQVHPCRPRGEEAAVVSAAIVRFAGARFLLGQAPARATNVDVTYESGRVVTVQPTEGIFVAAVDGDEPKGVAGRDAEGHDVFSIPLPPRPLDLDD
jgi:hypothetical protein